MATSQMVSNTAPSHAEANSTVSTIAIIGGGKVGLQLLSLFSQSSLTRVAYVVDKDPSAPASAAAREASISTFTDFRQALREARVDFIFEVTGSSKVAEMLHQELAGSATQLVTHDMAFVLLKVIEESREKTTGLVRAEVLEIEKEISSSLQKMTSTIENIKRTMGDLRFLAINARIEAAHAGDLGRGFDIVAQQVEKSAESVRDMTYKIEDVNANMSAISERIEGSLQKLV